MPPDVWQCSEHIGDEERLPERTRSPCVRGPEIISTTDLKGLIGYVDASFVQSSGFKPDERIGNNHNIIHRPDTPPAAFAHLWRTRKAGKP